MHGELIPYTKWQNAEVKSAFDMLCAWASKAKKNAAKTNVFRQRTYLRFISGRETIS